MFHHFLLQPIKGNPSKRRFYSTFMHLLSWVFLIITFLVVLSDRISAVLLGETIGDHYSVSMLCILTGTLLYILTSIIHLYHFQSHVQCLRVSQFIGFSVFLLGFTWQSMLNLPDIKDHVDSGYTWLSWLQITSGAVLATISSSVTLFRKLLPLIHSALFSVGEMHAARYLAALDIEAHGNDLKYPITRSFSTETSCEDTLFPITNN